MILNPYSIDINNIKLKQKIYYKKKRIYPIKYYEKQLIIQTPIVYLHWGISHYNSIDISLDTLCERDFDNKLSNFYKLIEKIENYFKNLYFFKKYKYHSSIKKHSCYSDILRVSLNKSDTLFFDENKNTIDHACVKSKSFCKLILHLSYIWINEDKFGIKWNISQAKYYKHIIYKPLEYSFIDSDDENENVQDVNKTDPTLDKYFKMLHMGIPKIAVINKMKLNGVDPNLLEKKKSTDTKKTISFLNQISSVTLKKNNSNKKEVIKKSNNSFIIKPEDLAKALQKIKQKSSNISKSCYI